MESPKKIDISFFLVKPSGGGGERVVLEVARNLSREGKRVELVLMRKEDIPEGFRDEGISIVHFNTSRFVRAFFLLCQYLKKTHPHTMLATNEHTSIILVLAKSVMRAKVRVVLRVGIPLSIQFARYSKFRDRLIPFLSRILYPRADHIIAVSRGVREDLIKTLGVKEEEVTVAYHPMDNEKIEQTGEEEVHHPWFSEGPVFVAVGRVREQKGFRYAIEAMKETPTDAKLLILGAGSGKEVLVKYAETCGVKERVAFLGFVKNPHAYVKRADVFILPSLWEGLPSALLEALALGIPAIASDCPHGPREILAPDTDISSTPAQATEYADYGILVPPMDALSLGEALRRICGDESLRKKYSERAKERARAFSKDEGMRVYKNILFPSI